MTYKDIMVTNNIETGDNVKKGLELSKLNFEALRRKLVACYTEDMRIKKMFMANQILQEIIEMKRNMFHNYVNLKKKGIT